MQLARPMQDRLTGGLLGAALGHPYWWMHIQLQA